MKLREIAFLTVVASFLAACSGGGTGTSALTPVDRAIARVSASCTSGPKRTAAQLVACIQTQALWNHMIAFQRIADENPGNDGHPNRNTGEPGYLASVNFVAGLMRAAGYRTTIQTYNYRQFAVSGVPSFSAAGRSFAYGSDWNVVRFSGSGHASARVVSVTGGCLAADFAAFARGDIALLTPGACDLGTQVARAQLAGASAIVFDRGLRARRPFQMQLTGDARIPVIGLLSSSVDDRLNGQYAQISVSARDNSSALDYNLIADSPYGDPNRVLVVEGHLDAIYGAGMLDNASGSATILEIALQLAHTPTRNHVRYVWFGGEEIGLLGSAYYTKSLTTKERHRIFFDVDADVTASPNYVIQIADPRYAYNVHQFPPNVVPESQIGNDFFADYFASVGMVAKPAPFGNDGTDSNSFSLIGIPDTGILTGQDCCKSEGEVDIWGGYRGNFEGDIPSFNGGCVDNPGLWCDNLANNDPRVLEFISKGVADVTFRLANYQGK